MTYGNILRHPYLKVRSRYGFLEHAKQLSSVQILKTENGNEIIQKFASEDLDISRDPGNELDLFTVSSSLDFSRFEI